MIVIILDYFKKLNNSSKLIASVVLAAFVISLLVFQTISLNELNSAIKQEESALTEDKIRLAHIKNIQSNYQKFQEKLYTLEASIPSSPLEESVLSSLQQTAEETQTDFTKVSFGKASDADGFVQQSINITFNGNYYNLLMLLEKVKSASRAVRFDTLSISKDKAKNSLKADIQAVCFYSSSPGNSVSAVKK